MRLPRFRTLSTHFLMVGGLMMVALMLLAGYLITAIVERDAVRGKAASTALFMQAIVAEHLTDLAASNTITPQAVAELDDLFAAGLFPQRFPYLEIWSPDGTIVYSNSSELLGQQFAPPPGLQRALLGEVAAEYTDLSAREHTIRGFESRFLEIYSPLRDAGGRVIAVAEIHEHAGPLERQLTELSRATWFVVAASTLLITGSLFGVVHRGSRTIERQEADLRARVREAEAISLQNLDLRDRVRRASVRVSQLNEESLKGVGADLHDGPTQLLSFAVLQAGHLVEIDDPEERRAASHVLISTLDDAIREIRGIAKGLLMAETTNQPLATVIRTAVHAHETRAGASVDVDLTGLDHILPPAVATSVYRFVQEGLSNAYRHASGSGRTSVKGMLRDEELTVSVHNPADATLNADAANEQGLGLVGLRSRIESLGGTVLFEIGADGRARLEMQLNVAEEVFGA